MGENGQITQENLTNPEHKLHLFTFNNLGINIKKYKVKLKIIHYLIKLSCLNIEFVARECHKSK